MLPILNVGDKRAVSWLNEFRVVLALARQGNEWSYVGRIVGQQPEARSLNREGHEHLTKPGAASACERLANPKIGILEVKLAKTPKKNVETRHYRIVPTLDGLSEILKVLHSGVLSVVRDTAWAQEVITKDIAGYLASEWEVEDGDVRKANPFALREMEFMARQSSKALEVLLGPKQFDLPKSDDSQKHLQALVERLRDLMHLACARDIASSTKSQLEERAWAGEIDLMSHLEFGNLSMTLRSRLVAGGRREESLPQGGKRIAKKKPSVA